MPTSEKEAEALAKACGRRFSTMTAQIRALIDQGAIHQAKKLRRRIFRSDSAKIFAMERANLKKGIKSAKLPMVADALSLRMDQRPDETVWRDRREKKDGTFRPIYSFGPMEYARQWLALQVANIFAPVSNRQFMHSGGVKSAADWLEANIKSRTVVTTTDIPDAFGVQNRVHLENDGLLPKVVMRSVLYDTMAEAKVPSYAAKLAQDVQLLHLSPKQVADRINGWAQSRAYDPSSAALAQIQAAFWRVCELLLRLQRGFDYTAHPGQFAVRQARQPMGHIDQHGAANMASRQLSRKELRRIDAKRFR